MKLEYRADIDGLRAIAVLAVIVFHLNATWLPSGFLGVDMFFVISGFLITQIISNEMAEQRFTFLNFYKRRAKRLLPALLVVLLTTTLAAWYVFLPDNFMTYLHSLRYVLQFAANFYFARNSDYFATDSAEQPLMHMWSLAVEEQFYFVFPVLFFWIFRKANKYIAFILLGLMVLSFVSGFYAYQKYDAYFLPQVRAYELLIGAWFADFLRNKQQTTNNKFYSPTSMAASF